MLGYVADVVVKSGGQENEADGNSASDEECVDDEVQELMDGSENVCLLFRY